MPSAWGIVKMERVSDEASVQARYAASQSKVNHTPDLGCGRWDRYGYPEYCWNEIQQSIS